MGCGNPRLRRLQRLCFHLSALLRLLCGFVIQQAALIGKLGGLLFHRDAHACNADSALFSFNALLRLNNLDALGIGTRAHALGALHVFCNAGLQRLQRRSLRNITIGQLQTGNCFRVTAGSINRRLTLSLSLPNIVE